MDTNKIIYYLAYGSARIPFYVGYTSHLNYVQEEIEFFQNNPKYIFRFGRDNKHREIHRLVLAGEKIDLIPVSAAPSHVLAAQERKRVIDFMCDQGFPLVNGSINRRINTPLVTGMDESPENKLRSLFYQLSHMRDNTFIESHRENNVGSDT